jgi:large subunit ribosomal protein L1
MKHGKKWREVHSKVDRIKEYPLVDALDFLKNNLAVKFNETVDVAVNLGIDPRKSDQTVRSAVSLPNGLGKEVRVLVFAQGEKEKEAQEAGADYTGGEDVAKKIQEGWLEFDAVVATPDMMKVVGKLGKILGTRGLMPNPKVGTVTMDIAKAVRELKAGKVEFKAEKAGILHAPLGKLSFTSQALAENIKAFMEAVNKAKPASAKGLFIKKVTVSSTMGQGLKVKLADLK